VGVANKGRGVPPREHLGEQSAWRRVCSHLQPKGAPPTAGGKPARRVGGPLLGPFKIQEQRPPQLAASSFGLPQPRKIVERQKQIGVVQLRIRRYPSSPKNVLSLDRRIIALTPNSGPGQSLGQIKVFNPKEHVANLARNGTRAFNGFHSSRLLRAVRCLSTKPM